MIASLLLVLLSTYYLYLGNPIINLPEDRIYWVLGVINIVVAILNLI